MSKSSRQPKPRTAPRRTDRWELTPKHGSWKPADQLEPTSGYESSSVTEKLAARVRAIAKSKCVLCSTPATKIPVRGFYSLRNRYDVHTERHWAPVCRYCCSRSQRILARWHEHTALATAIRNISRQLAGFAPRDPDEQS